MPGKTTKARRPYTRYRRGLAIKLERIVYDYVYDNFGRSEAESPSWYIPNLADYVAQSLSAARYTPRHDVHYEED